MNAKTTWMSEIYRICKELARYPYYKGIRGEKFGRTSKHFWIQQKVNIRWIFLLYEKYESSHVRQVSFSQFYAFGFYPLFDPFSCKFNGWKTFPNERWYVGMSGTCKKIVADKSKLERNFLSFTRGENKTGPLTCTLR